MDDYDSPVTNQQQQPETENKSNMQSPVKLIVSGILLIVALVVTLMTFKVVTIEGNQLGIKETWSGGVEKTVMLPKTYFLFPGFSQTVFKYDASSQVFVMNDKEPGKEKTAIGRDADAYLVQSAEGQDMKISLNLRWRIDSTKLVQIHTTVRQDIEDKIIRPVVMRVVKDKATKMKAIDAYSGEGLVKLQQDIQEALSGKDQKETDELAERGVIVENFVIEHIELDPNYIAEIKKKQIATQQQLRAVEEQKAAEAEALVAKSKAQADLNTQVVAAERDAKVKVVGAQAAAEQVTINAKAQAEQVTIAAEAAAKQVQINAKAQAEQVTIAAKAAAAQVEMAAEAQKKQLSLEGEGQKLKQVAEAEGILAQGKAKAASQQLLLEAYAAKGADAWVKTQVAESAAKAFSGVKGYLPADMKVNLLTGQFQGAVDALTGNPVVPASTK